MIININNNNVNVLLKNISEMHVFEPEAMNWLVLQMTDYWLEASGSQKGWLSRCCLCSQELQQTV